MTEAKKHEIIEMIKAGKTLPKSYIYDLFAGDEEDVFLFWNGRREEVTNVALPFHSIEQIDEPRAEKADALGFVRPSGAAAQGMDKQADLGRQQIGAVIIGQWRAAR